MAEKEHPGAGHGKIRLIDDKAGAAAVVSAYISKGFFSSSSSSSSSFSSFKVRVAAIKVLLVHFWSACFSFFLSFFKGKNICCRTLKPHVVWHLGTIHQGVFIRQHHVVVTSVVDDVGSLVAVYNVDVLAAEDGVFASSARNRIFPGLPVDDVLAIISLNVILPSVSVATTWRIIIFLPPPLYETTATFLQSMQTFGDSPLTPLAPPKMVSFPRWPRIVSEQSNT